MEQVREILTDEVEVREFQKVFPASGAAMLLAKIVGKLGARYEMELHDRGSGAETMRFSQGALDALGRLEIEVAAFADYVFHEDEDIGPQEDDDVGPDTSF